MTASTVLVTGASGLLGRAVAAELASRGHAVRTLQRRPSGLVGDGLAVVTDVLGPVTEVLGSVTDVLGSVTDAEVVARAVDGVDGIVHLAAKVSLAGDPAEFAAVNVGGTRTLLDAAEAAGVPRFVQVSSPSVAHAGDPLVGAGADPADPARAHGLYAQSKAEGELLALTRDRELLALTRDRPGFAVVAVRPHLVWGPGDTQLVERIVERARHHRLPLLDDGTALIDSTYIDNAASAIAAALGRAGHPDAHGRAFVVTNGEPRPVAELIAEICLAAGVQPPRWSVPAGLARAAGGAVERWWALRPGSDEPPMTRFLAEQLSTAHWFDQRATRHALDWAPSVTLDEGFRRLAAHYARR